MKKIDRRIIIVVAFIFIVGLSFGIMKYLISLKEEAPVRSAKEMLRYVQSETVKYSVLTSPVEASGRLNSLSSIDLVAEASGKITKGSVALKKGSVFAKGDLLFSVYRDEADMALKGKKSQFLNTLANLLPDLRIDYPDYEEDFMKFFLEVDIEKDLPQLPEFKNEKLKIFLSSRNVLNEYYSIRKDELQLVRHSVNAPFAGTFTDVYLEVGAYTNTGGKVAHAIQTDLLELEVPMKKSDASWVKIGDKVEITRGDNTDQKWIGTVIRKGMFVEENYQMQAIFIRVVNNTNYRLLNGEYLTAIFPGIPVEDVMEIPRNSVFNFDEVFVVVDGRLQKRIIDIVKVNEKSLIFRGLSEGDVVVTQPLINVQEGTLVTTELVQAGPGQGKGQKQEGDALADKAKPDERKKSTVSETKTNN